MQIIKECTIQLNVWKTLRFCKFPKPRKHYLFQLNVWTKTLVIVDCGHNRSRPLCCEVVPLWPITTTTRIQLHFTTVVLYFIGRSSLSRSSIILWNFLFDNKLEVHSSLIVSIEIIHYGFIYYDSYLLGRKSKLYYYPRVIS